MTVNKHVIHSEVLLSCWGKFVREKFVGSYLMLIYFSFVGYKSMIDYGNPGPSSSHVPYLVST